MNKKYKIDSLGLEKISFATLFDQKSGPSFADLEANFQPDPADTSRLPTDKEKQRRRPSPKPARIEPQSQLDLHGLTAEEAERKTRNYLLTQKKNGRSIVRIITGKGLHSPGPGGVLRDVVELILLEGKKNGLLTQFSWEKHYKEQSGAVLVHFR